MVLMVLDPVQEPIITRHTLARRLTTLSGKTLGLYNNSKLNAERLLELIRLELETRFSFDIVRGVYDATDLVPLAAWGDIESCDAVILATGDCGACSSSGIANAIELEKRGIPTLLVSTPPFFQAVSTFAELRGMPEIQWAVVDHPIGSLDEDELRQRASAAADQFLTLILQPSVESSAA